MASKPGDRVTLYAPNSWEWIVSYYGVLKTGAVINPVNVMLTPAEIAYVTKDCGAKALIGSPEKVVAALAAGVSGLTAIVFGDASVAGATAVQRTDRQTPFVRAGRGRGRRRFRPSATRQEPPATRRARCNLIGP